MSSTCMRRDPTRLNPAGRGADQGGMVLSAVTTAWVVRAPDGHVVIVFWGADAEDEVREWEQRRGYRVERTTVALDR